MKQYRQGEVLLVGVKKTKATTEAKQLMLARGSHESKNHILHGRLRYAPVSEKEREAYIKELDLLPDAIIAFQINLLEDGKVTSTHDAMSVPKGKYIVLKQIEYDLIKGIREVTD